MNDNIQIGDVALDLTQGRPVHVVDATGQIVAEWSDANGYDLLENYGNDRVDTEADEMVYDCVYCSSANSEPTKTYAMPSSRLLRIETEAADDGRPVADRVAVDILAAVIDSMRRYEALDSDDVTAVMDHVGLDPELVQIASELVDVDHTIGNGDAVDPSAGGSFET